MITTKRRTPYRTLVTPRAVRGQSIVEFGVICALVAIVLFVPDSNGVTPLQNVMNAIRTSYANFSFTTSLP
jgi:Flp pilus assembly pilin Flp